MSHLHRVLDRAARLATLLITVGLLLGWFFALRPVALGGPASYALIRGPSMEPTFLAGDLVITQRAEAYAVGDIVLFRVKNALVIHRIVGGDPISGYETRGDNNGVADGFRPTIGAIDGKAWLHLPGVGRTVTVVRQPVPLAICTWMLTSVILLRRWSRPPPMAAADTVTATDA